MSTKESNRHQLRNIALIFAGVSFALGSLYFFNDAHTDWAISLQAQNPSESIPMGPFSDFVRGFALSTGTVSWLVGCMLVGVALTATAIWNNRKTPTA
jgi:hypothetical protein